MGFMGRRNVYMWTLILLCLCVLRIFLELVQFDFASLPTAKILGEEKSKDIHRSGFYLSVGLFVLLSLEFL